MSKFKAVVVGAGGISGAWFPPLLAEKVNIVGVVDINVAAARQRAEEHKLACETSDNLAGTLKRTRPDFVVDLTIPEAHGKVVCTALRHGCHVIGEKPMAGSMAEARRMVRAAREAEKLYMVSQSRRYDAVHDAARRLIASGKIGKITTVQCDFFMGAHFGGFREEMPSPLILDMAIHHFDLARYFTGLDPRAVYAKEFNPAGSWYQGDVSASCIFEMSDGAMFTYRGSWCAEGCPTSWNGSWRFIGEKGTILLENDQPARGQVVAGDKPAFHVKLKDIHAPKPTLKFLKQHGALREFLAYLRTGRQPQGECHDNIKSLAMVFAAIESNQKSKRLAVRV
ncbi:MAG: Gfo/Idh/MocA family oxidoreductase [Phycisphaerae bacterium]|nr:Gfo/Idh/MocA family oxidoreductase [Phycisphaerae bacterium]